MITVLEYRLPESTAFDLELHAGAVVLDVQTKSPEGFIYIWVESDTERPRVKRTFRLYRTGEEIQESRGDLRYIGSVPLGYGRIVQHLFEVRP